MASSDTSREVLAIYLDGNRIVWPGRFLVMDRGSFKVMDILWDTEDTSPEAAEVTTPWVRTDTAAMIQMWRVRIRQDEEVVDEENDIVETVFKQAGPWSRAQEKSVGWILDTLLRIGEEIEPLGGGVY